MPKVLWIEDNINLTDPGILSVANKDKILKVLDLNYIKLSNWNTFRLPSGEYPYWKTVSYGNNVYIAGSDQGCKAAYSTDCITWSWCNTTESISSYICASCYGKDKFIGVKRNSSNAVYSYDGINWNLTTMPSGDWRAVCYGKDKFVAVSDNSNKAAYSTDGIHWNNINLPFSNFWSSVCYGNELYVAVGYNGGGLDDKIAYSTDGIHWNKSITDKYMPSVYSVCYGNGKFVAISGVGNHKYAAISIDGKNWKQVELPTSARRSSVCYGENMFIAVAENTSEFVYSTDGLYWQIGNLLKALSYSYVHYCNNKFIVIAEGNSDLYYLDTLKNKTSFYNTSNANITSNDVAKNKTAYGKDGKVIGTNEDIQNYGKLIKVYNSDEMNAYLLSENLGKCLIYYGKNTNKYKSGSIYMVVNINNLIMFRKYTLLR